MAADVSNWILFFAICLLNSDWQKTEEFRIKSINNYFKYVNITAYLTQVTFRTNFFIFVIFHFISCDCTVMNNSIRTGTCNHGKWIQSIRMLLGIHHQLWWFRFYCRILTFVEPFHEPLSLVNDWCGEKESNEIFNGFNFGTFSEMPWSNWEIRTCKSVNDLVYYALHGTMLTIWWTWKQTRPTGSWI